MELLKVENLSFSYPLQRNYAENQNKNTGKLWKKAAYQRRVAEMACFFGIDDWFRKKTSELSGGQKQLLNLASIMAMQPKILILDEPTSQLDPIAASDFINTLVKIWGLR